MTQPVPRDLLDPLDTIWTVEEAAAHFGVTSATIRRYIRAGLTLYEGRWVRRDEVLAEYARRQKRQHESRTSA